MHEARTILVPVDFTQHSRAAAIRACQLASASGASVRLVHALDPGKIGKRDSVSEGSEESWDDARRAGERQLGELQRELMRRGAPLQSILEERDPVDTIVAQATPEEVGLIVMGPHGFQESRRLFLGSVAAGVIGRASIPVMTVKGNGRDATSRIRRILLATDFSEEAQGALGIAVEWARWLGADVEVMHAIAVGNGGVEASRLSADPSKVRNDALEALREILDRMRSSGIPASAELTHGPASLEIVKRAGRSRADLVVLGRHGRSRTSGAACGQVADRVLRHARCSVMLVPDSSPTLN